MDDIRKEYSVLITLFDEELITVSVNETSIFRKHRFDIRVNFETQPGIQQSSMTVLSRSYVFC